MFGGIAAVASVVAINMAAWILSADDGDTVPSDDPWWSGVLIFSLFLGLPVFVFGAAFAWLGASQRRT